MPKNRLAKANSAKWINKMLLQSHINYRLRDFKAYKLICRLYLHPESNYKNYIYEKIRNLKSDWIFYVSKVLLIF